VIKEATDAVVKIVMTTICGTGSVTLSKFPEMKIKAPVNYDQAINKVKT